MWELVHVDSRDQTRAFRHGGEDFLSPVSCFKLAFLLFLCLPLREMSSLCIPLIYEHIIDACKAIQTIPRKTFLAIMRGV